MMFFTEGKKKGHISFLRNNKRGSRQADFRFDSVSTYLTRDLGDITKSSDLASPRGT